MTIEVQTPRVIYIGNGTRGPFSLQDGSGNPIRLRTATDLVLWRYSSTTDEVGEQLVYSTDFTVINTDPDAATFTLTSVQPVLTSSQRLVVTREQSVSQDLSLTLGGNFGAVSDMAQRDIVAEQIQELRRDVDRAIKPSWRSTVAPTLPIAPSETKLLGHTSDDTLAHVEVATISPTGVTLGSGWSTVLGLAATSSLDIAVDARLYGFKVGGGNADATANTAALQAALDANYWVQLPAGAAYINAITHTMVNRLSGAGTAANGTKLVLANSANSRCFIASSRTDMVYEDFIVDMNFANNVGSGAHDAFRLETCTKPVFRNVRVTGAQGLFSGSPVGSGFSLLNGSGARFYDCEATLCFDGLQSTGHTDCVVVGGYYNTNRRFGIVMGTASHRAKFYDVVANGNSTTDSSGGNWLLQDSDDCVAHTLTLNDAVLAFGGLVSGSDRFRGFDITANGNGLDGFGPYDSLDCRVDGLTALNNAVRGMTIDTSSHMARFTNGYCFGNVDMDVSVFRSANVVVQDANFLTGRVHEAAVAQSAAINAAGSGYTNGTFLCTMNGGTIGPLGRPSFNVTVSGGAVTAVSALVNTGEVWILPNNPVTVTGLAAGSGATFNMTWLGANQQTATKVTFRGGGDGAAMELAVDPLTGGSATSAAIFEGFRGALTDPSGVAVQAAIGCTNFKVPVRTASLQNGWVVQTRAVYYKDSDGIVHVEGRIASGTVAADTLLFVLPVGFRPANSERFIVDANGSLGRIYVEPDGDVRDLGGTCSAAGTSLNTIRFRAV